MKKLSRILAEGALLIGLTWAGSVSAQDYIVNTFDTAAEAGQWAKWWGGPAQTYEFDAAVDAEGNPNSGSLKVTVQFDLATHGGDNQFSARKDLPTVVNGLSYGKLVMDVFLDPGSPQRPWGDLGRLEYGIRHSDYSQDYFGYIDLPTTGGWIHLEAAIPTANPGIDDIAGVSFKMWSGDASWGQTGTWIMWVDNIKFTIPPPPPYIINEFDSADEVSSWARWWGAAAQTYEFDPAMDVNNDTASGSLKVTVEFDYATHGGDNQFSALRNLDEPLNGLDFTDLEMDVFVAETSPTNPSGNFGYFEYGIRHSDYSQDYFGNITLPGVDGWQHLVATVPWTHDMIDDIMGFTFKLWAGNTGSALTGTTTFWVDNIHLIPKQSTEVIRPEMAVEKAVPGLRLFASQGGQQYQRQGIRTVSDQLSWVPRAFDPVTYTINIKKYPDQAHSGFQTHLFLVPTTSPDDSYIDWNATNVVFVQIANNNDGSGTARFMYKVNQPEGNSMLWNTDPGAGPVGTLAFLWSPHPYGSWSVTFDNLENSITMTEPGGSYTNFAMMPAEDAALFANPVYAYVGIQPNQANNVGQDAILAGISMKCEDTFFPSFEDDFSGTELDPARWTVVAADSAGIVLVPLDAVYWVSWTVPDAGFALQFSPTLGPASWTEFVLPYVTQVAGRKMGLVNQGVMPDSATGFWVMVKPD